MNGAFMMSPKGAFLRSPKGARLFVKRLTEGNLFVSGVFTLWNALPFLPDSSTDVLSISTNVFPDAMPVRVRAIDDGILPDPLLPDTTYYVRDSTDISIKLASSPGGSAINLTDEGTGSFIIGSDFSPDTDLGVEADNNAVYDPVEFKWSAADAGADSIKTSYCVVTHDTGGDVSLYAADGSENVYRWIVDGSGWELLPEPGFIVHCLVDYDGILLGLGTDGSDSVIKSFDGVSWSAPLYSPPEAAIYDAIYSGGVLYCGASTSGGQGVFMSYDFASWATSSGAGGGTDRIRRIALFGSYLYGIFGSIGGGLVRWNKVDSGSAGSAQPSGTTNAGDLLAVGSILYFSTVRSGGGSVGILVAIENDALDYTEVVSFAGGPSALYLHSQGLLIYGTSGLEDGTKLGTFLYLLAGSELSSLAGSVAGPVSKMIEVKVTLRYNEPPASSITSPDDGDAFDEGATITFIGTGTDPEDGDVTSSLEWSSDIDDTFGTGGTVNINTLSPGEHFITATATDDEGKPGSSSISIKVWIGHGPVLTIDTPANGATVSSPVTLEGTATDTEDGDISANIEWSSRTDGYLGTGDSISAALTSGSHQITASIEDSDGNIVTETITITVT